jgi:hypothetical protein
MEDKKYPPNFLYNDIYKKEYNFDPLLSRSDAKSVAQSNGSGAASKPVNSGAPKGDAKGAAKKGGKKKRVLSTNRNKTNRKKRRSNKRRSFQWW